MGFLQVGDNHGTGVPREALRTAPLPGRFRATKMTDPVVHPKQVWDTMTRTEVMKARGYSDEVVSGNGAVARLEPPAEPLSAEIGQEHLPISPPLPGAMPAESSDEFRVCCECQVPIPAGFAAKEQPPVFLLLATSSAARPASRR